MIVGLSGFAQSGKDTAGKILVDHHGFTRVSFADRLKALALDMDPILEVEADLDTVPFRAHLSEISSVYGNFETAKVQVPAVRGHLQELGVKARKHLGPDVWVEAALRDHHRDAEIVVTDVRFPNEAQAIIERGGIVLRIERPGTGPVNGHISEHALDDWGFHNRILNDGSLADLEARLVSTIDYWRVGQETG